MNVIERAASLKYGSVAVQKELPHLAAELRDPSAGHIELGVTLNVQPVMTVDEVTLPVVLEPEQTRQNGGRVAGQKVITGWKVRAGVGFQSVPALQQLLHGGF